MPDEPTQDRPRRRRPVLLAMLVLAAVLLMVAGSGIAGGGPSRSSDDGGLSRDRPATQQAAPGATDPGMGQFRHHGRHCHHDHGGNQAPQQSPTEAPPV